MKKLEIIGDSRMIMILQNLITNYSLLHPEYPKFDLKKFDLDKIEVRE